MCVFFKLSYFCRMHSWHSHSDYIGRDIVGTEKKVAGIERKVVSTNQHTMRDAVV